MSVTKLLSRIANPMEASPRNRIADLASHPLTQFSCVLAALIHDVSHPGVPNNVLVREKNHLALKYKGRSVAEQNSFNVAWNLLMKPEYEDMRNCIYATPEELQHFRSVLIQLVGSTDIMEKNLGQERKARWERAFKEDPHDKSLGGDKIKFQATIVLEHLLQASDVSHTMQ